MKVLITGASGLLGSELARVLSLRDHAVVATVRDPDALGSEGSELRALDVTDAEAVRTTVDETAPEVVFHCAAYTDVDGAEAHPHRAMAVNADGTRTVAHAALKSGAALVYPSTDYVFDGTKEGLYLPGDPRRPVNAYGRSKKAGEDALRAVGGRWLVLRTTWLYGAGGPDFVDTVLEKARAGEKLRVVDDQTGRPTWSGSLAPALVDLVERAVEAPDWLPMPPAGRGSPAGLTGRILHLADRGTATWYDFARAIADVAGIDAEIEPVSSAEWNAPAARPKNCVLDISAAEECLGRQMPDWKSSLERYLSTEIMSP